MVTLRKANNMGKLPPNILFTRYMANRLSRLTAYQRSRATRIHLNPNPSSHPISHLILLHKTKAKIKLLSLINDQLVYKMFYHFI